MELKIDGNDAMKIKEITDAVIEDGESVGLLADYILTDLWDDPYDDEIFDWLDYFLTNRWLEVNRFKRVDMMHIIEDFWKETSDVADELASWDRDDFYDKKSVELAKKIIWLCEPLGCMTAPDGTVTLPDSIWTESKKTERITFAELDRRIWWSILCNNMWNRYWSTMELVSWDIYEKDEFGREDWDPVDIFQYYFISDSWADYLKNCTDQLVFYDDELDVYVWWITHLGTSWDYVYVDIHY